VFCRKHPVDEAWRPFCSERCKLLDLARWVDSAYRVPAEPAPPPNEDAEDETRQ
jgi:hypothetical protein